VDYPGARITVLTGVNDSGTAIGWAAPANAYNFGLFYDISTAQFSGGLGGV